MYGKRRFPDRHPCVHVHPTKIGTNRRFHHRTYIHAWKGTSKNRRLCWPFFIIRLCLPQFHNKIENISMKNFKQFSRCRVKWCCRSLNISLQIVYCCTAQYNARWNVRFSDSFISHRLTSIEASTCLPSAYARWVQRRRMACAFSINVNPTIRIVWNSIRVARLLGRYQESNGKRL